MPNVDLKPIAKLAQIFFTEEELAVYQPQVVSILGMVEELKGIDTEKISPTSHPLAMKNVFREDRAQLWPAIDEFLKHAPVVHRRFFEVPKVIEGS
jgi:aspartyl-tRNA(Asn)/glutamyl-tRNA(Gln) amidotransferase subunit C